MDPHSRLSQYNQRKPKAGPIRTSRTEAKMPAVVLEGFTKRPAAKGTKDIMSSISRPVVSNARVRKDEQYRKDMYLSYVNNALRQKAKGNGEAYEELVGQFNPKNIAATAAPAISQLRLLLLAMSHVVSQLDRTHSSLVEAVVIMPWMTMEPSFVKTYISFIGMLVSARPEYLSLILRKTVRGMTYDFGLQALNANLAEGSSRPLTRRAVYDRLHSLLQHILNLIPTLPSTLQPLLVQNFPHKRENQVAQITYISNLLRIAEYCAELSDRIISLIIDRAMQIDVEIQVELEELETEGDTESAEIFELDPFDTVVGQDGDESDSDSENEGGAAGFSDLSSDEGNDDDDAKRPAGDLMLDVPHVRSMACKLDAILQMVFKYFSRHLAENPAGASIPSGESTPDPSKANRPESPDNSGQSEMIRKARFLNLLMIFDRTIIRTFKSRYTQFLVFWYSSLDPEFSDLFQGLLISRALLDADQPSVIRAAAASYIGSFVSRASFVDKASTRRVVGLLCDFLASNLDVYEMHALNPGSLVLQAALQHNIFYAVAQAFFLIYCFRWRDLLQETDDEDEFSLTPSDGRKWMRELNVVHRLITSPLNPLKVCSRSVVEQFAQVARHTGLVYCFSIMETNRRAEYASSSQIPSTPNGRMVSENNGQTPRTPAAFRLSLSASAVDMDLTTFFPFDPYNLPRSSSYIKSIYRDWSSVAIYDDEDSDEDSQEEAEEEEEQSDANRRESSDVAEDDTGFLGASFNGMSISPARPMQLTAAVS